MENSKENLAMLAGMEDDYATTNALEDILRVAMKSKSIKLTPPAEADGLVLQLGRYINDTDPITNYGTKDKPVYYVYYRTYNGTKYTFPAYFFLNDCYVGKESLAVHLKKKDAPGFPAVMAIRKATEMEGDDRKVYALSQYNDYYQGVYAIEDEKEKKAEMSDIRESGKIDGAVKNLAKLTIVVGLAAITKFISKRTTKK